MNVGDLFLETITNNRRMLLRVFNSFFFFGDCSTCILIFRTGNSELSSVVMSPKGRPSSVMHVSRVRIGGFIGEMEG